MKRLMVMAMAAGLLALVWGESKKPVTWPVTQLTECNNGKVSAPQISADGQRLFFVSDCDFAQQNRDHNTEIFSWEAGKFTQLTSAELCLIDDLALAPDDARLAFVSDCDFNRMNPGKGLELMLRAEDGQIKVLTQNPGFPSLNPAWASDGKGLAFESRANLAEHNPENARQIFMADLDETVAFRQLSRAKNPYGCERPQVATGAVIALCNADFPGTTPPPRFGEPFYPAVIYAASVGANPDHNHELMSFDPEGTPRQLTFTQNCENGPFALRTQGNLIAFVSNCNFGNNGFAGPAPSLYFFSSKISAPFPDLTLTAAGLAFSPDGTRLALSSPFSRQGMNPEANLEIFLVTIPQQDLTRPLPLSALTPVTNFPYGASTAPALSKDGRALAFISTANDLARNNDHTPELFRALEPQSGDTAE